MTPRRLDPETIHRRLRHMRDLLAELSDLGGLDEHALSTDYRTRRTVERDLALLIQDAVAINSHVTAAELHRAPKDYGASFADAAAVGLLSEALAAELSPAAGLRNALVHDYLDLDLARVAGAVPLALTGFDRYLTEVARYLQDRAHDPGPERTGGADT